jgi:hypothetical protein
MAPQTLNAQSTLNNDAVIKLVKADEIANFDLVAALARHYRPIHG